MRILAVSAAPLDPAAHARLARLLRTTRPGLAHHVDLAYLGPAGANSVKRHAGVVGLRGSHPEPCLVLALGQVAKETLAFCHNSSWTIVAIPHPSSRVRLWWTDPASEERIADRIAGFLIDWRIAHLADRPNSPLNRS